MTTTRHATNTCCVQVRAADILTLHCVMFVTGRGLRTVSGRDIGMVPQNILVSRLLVRHGDSDQNPRYQPYKHAHLRVRRHQWGISS